MPGAAADPHAHISDLTEEQSILRLLEEQGLNAAITALSKDYSSAIAEKVFKANFLETTWHIQKNQLVSEEGHTLSRIISPPADLNTDNYTPLPPELVNAYAALESVIATNNKVKEGIVVSRETNSDMKVVYFFSRDSQDPSLVKMTAVLNIYSESDLKEFLAEILKNPATVEAALATEPVFLETNISNQQIEAAARHTYLSPERVDLNQVAADENGSITKQKELERKLEELHREYVETFKGEIDERELLVNMIYHTKHFVDWLSYELGDKARVELLTKNKSSLLDRLKTLAQFLQEKKQGENKPQQNKSYKQTKSHKRTVEKRDTDNTMPLERRKDRRADLALRKDSLVALSFLTHKKRQASANATQILRTRTETKRNGKNPFAVSSSEQGVDILTFVAPLIKGDKIGQGNRSRKGIDKKKGKEKLHSVALTDRVNRKRRLNPLEKKKARKKISDRKSRKWGKSKAILNPREKPLKREQKSRKEVGKNQSNRLFYKRYTISFLAVVYKVVLKVRRFLRKVRLARNKDNSVSRRNSLKMPLKKRAKDFAVKLFKRSKDTLFSRRTKRVRQKALKQKERRRENKLSSVKREKLQEKKTKERRAKGKIMQGEAQDGFSLEKEKRLAKGERLDVEGRREAVSKKGLRNFWIAIKATLQRLRAILKARRDDIERKGIDANLAEKSKEEKRGDNSKRKSLKEEKTLKKKEGLLIASDKKSNKQERAESKKTQRESKRINDRKVLKEFQDKSADKIRVEEETIQDKSAKTHRIKKEEDKLNVLSRNEVVRDLAEPILLTEGMIEEEGSKVSQNKEKSEEREALAVAELGTHAVVEEVNSKSSGRATQNSREINIEIRHTGSNSRIKDGSSYKETELLENVSVLSKDLAESRSAEVKEGAEAKEDRKDEKLLQRNNIGGLETREQIYTVVKERVAPKTTDNARDRRMLKDRDNTYLEDKSMVSELEHKAVKRSNKKQLLERIVKTQNELKSKDIFAEVGEKEEGVELVEQRAAGTHKKVDAWKEEPLDEKKDVEVLQYEGLEEQGDIVNKEQIAKEEDYREEEKILNQNKGKRAVFGEEIEVLPTVNTQDILEVGSPALEETNAALSNVGEVQQRRENVSLSNNDESKLRGDIDESIFIQELEEPFRSSARQVSSLREDTTVFVEQRANEREHLGTGAVQKKASVVRREDLIREGDDKKTYNQSLVLEEELNVDDKEKAFIAVNDMSEEESQININDGKEAPLNEEAASVISSYNVLSSGEDKSLVSEEIEAEKIVENRPRESREDQSFEALINEAKVEKREAFEERENSKAEAEFKTLSFEEDIGHKEKAFLQDNRQKISEAQSEGGNGFRILAEEKDLEGLLPYEPNRDKKAPSSLAAISYGLADERVVEDRQEERREGREESFLRVNTLSRTSEDLRDEQLEREPLVYTETAVERAYLASEEKDKKESRAKKRREKLRRRRRDKVLKLLYKRASEEWLLMFMERAKRFMHHPLYLELLIYELLYQLDLSEEERFKIKKILQLKNFEEQLIKEMVKVLAQEEEKKKREEVYW